jgi:hypothetical protein
VALRTENFLYQDKFKPPDYYFLTQNEGVKSIFSAKCLKSVPNFTSNQLKPEVKKNQSTINFDCCNTVAGY